MNGNEEKKICLQFDVKKPETKPKGSQGVSSLFKRPVPAQTKIDQKPEKPKPVPKAKIIPNDIKNEMQEKKNENESPFLKLLRERKNNIKPPAPVPVESCFNEYIPPDEVGKLILKQQGWKEGDENINNSRSNQKK